MAKYLLAGADGGGGSGPPLPASRPRARRVLLDGLSGEAEKRFAGIDEARGMLAVPRDADADLNDATRQCSPSGPRPV